MTKEVQFDDEGALDTYIALADLSEEQAAELKENVYAEGFGEPVPVPENDED